WALGTDARGQVVQQVHRGDPFGRAGALPSAGSGPEQPSRPLGNALVQQLPDAVSLAGGADRLERSPLIWREVVIGERGVGVEVKLAAKCLIRDRPVEHFLDGLKRHPRQLHAAMPAQRTAALAGPTIAAPLTGGQLVLWS